MFLTLVPLESATASTLYEHIKSVFNELNIPYKDNMIGFAADGASVMMGKNNSLSTHLKQDIPNLFVMKCTCHSFHLCASYACKKLPRWVEDVARDIYNYFLSPKQTMALKEFQEFVNVKPHKILHPSQTRWLSLHSVVKRLLEQLPALKLFFTQAALKDRLVAAETILQRLNDPITKLYLEFLDHVLPFFCDLNKEMQAQDPKIYTLKARISAVLFTILECYLKPSYLNSTPLDKVRVRDPGNFLPLEDIYLGGRVTATLQATQNIIQKEYLHNFRLRCLDFYIESALQIMQRFNLSDPIYEDLKALNPQSVMKKAIPSVAPLASKFPNIVNENDLNSIDREWRLLRNTEMNAKSDISAWEFWMEVKHMKKGDDTPLFPLLGNFMVKLLTLPHSSSCVERIFSQVNLMKTKTRNSLNTETLIGMLHAKRTFESATSDTFTVTTDHMKLMTEKIYESNPDHQDE
ncbi:SCAN domain-containing protein 3-like [Palaemon carinicauda]|uniref:SCAN domain-containing protein 3-like n=1 Tax=Palaemon carinicauda TaxID=392227 RepID=UPI0035B667C1